MESAGLLVTTREFHGYVDDPALPETAGAVAVCDEIIGVHPNDDEAIYRHGYVPNGQESTEFLPFSLCMARRFIDYYKFFNDTDNVGQTDCFALASHISTGQPLETIRGQGLEYQLRGAVRLAILDNIEAGYVYFNGKLAGSRIVDINHYMIGMGGDRVLAQWGAKSGAGIGLAAAQMAISVYGGQLFKAFGGPCRTA